MKRCVLLKLTPGTDPVEVQEKLWKGFNRLDETLEWVNHPVIRRSCVQGDDFDLMIKQADGMRSRAKKEGKDRIAGEKYLRSVALTLHDRPHTRW